ncbi:3',5'-cyclic-nucleotide phosphodiesterase [Dissophora globulifera]|nr:3',5'-cyclic-nucleotide phosphodiesterase [Dissophora globulifera]
MILLVDVDTDLELTPPHSPASYTSRAHRPTAQKGAGSWNGDAGISAAKSLQGGVQHQQRATSDNTALKGSHQRSRRAQSRAPKQNDLDGTLCGLDFLETVLQGLAKGTLHHVVPIAISSTSSQDRILELFNLGVADVLLKPVEEQAARTLFLERVEELKIRLLSWDFHPHDLCEDDLMRCVVIVIEEVMKLDGLGDLNIPQHLLHRLVIGLRDSYHRSNPYHNFAHAVDVLQAAFYFLCRMGKLPLSGFGNPPFPESNGHISPGTAKSEPGESPANIPAVASPGAERDIPTPVRVQDFLRPEDIFALVVASIGHDVGHPGVNNMFLVNAHTPLAQVYNDRSVLESFHSMALFQVMKKHGFECFDVDSQNRKFMEFRKMVVSTILATDMGLHFDYVGKIREQTERIRARGMPGGDVPKSNQASIDEQERLVLCGTLIKCADISNASRPFHVAERWSTVLLQEMCNQADIEKEMAMCSGLHPVPTGSTKSLANDRGMQIDSQLGFIHGFAMPLFSSVKEMVPEMGYCVDYLQINHRIWQDRKTEYVKNGGGSNIAAVDNNVKASHEDIDSHAEEQVPQSPKRTSNQFKAKAPAGKGGPGVVSKDGIRTGSRRPQHASETYIDGQGVGSDTAKPHSHAGTGRRSANVSNGGLSDGSSSLSSIPRPRTRTKTPSSETPPVPGGHGQDSSQNGHHRGRAGQHGSRSRLTGLREPNSRVRTVTSTTTLSVPISSSSSGLKSGNSSDKGGSRPESPVGLTVPSKPSSRGQRSPGRRPQGNSRGQGHGQNAKQDKLVTVTTVKEEVFGTRLDQPESMVLSSLLPVPDSELAIVASELMSVETSPSISSAEL